MLRKKPLIFSLWLLSLPHVNHAFAVAHNIKPLEEVIVTANKRENSLQDIPISIAVLTSSTLDSLAVRGLQGLMDGTIPSLRISPNGNAQTTLTLAIRGDAATDMSQPTKQAPVAVYTDGIYLGRQQGLSIELADLQRIEVLRGPQGTLFGRNTTSGAVHLISRKPSGEFSFQQTAEVGNFNAFRSVTRVDLPTVASVSAKLDYVHSERDGWVKNLADDQADFNEYNNSGSKLSLRLHAQDKLLLDYVFDHSDIKNANLYFQVYDDFIGAIGRERTRRHHTRFALALEPIKIDVSGHALVATWQMLEHLTVKSLTAYRELNEDGSNNLGGAFYFNGLVLDEDIEQRQFSQELQLIGSINAIDWVAGIFYFEEHSDFDIRFLFSLDQQFNPVIPAISNPFVPPTFVSSDAKSVALYTQGTFPLSEQLHLTVGSRYTIDEKSAYRNNLRSTDIDSDHVDGTAALHYSVNEELAVYLRYASAYKAGGYNARALDFEPFQQEVNHSWELGLKSQWYDNRVRVNAAAFHNTLEDKQFDYIDPQNTLFLETLNATKDVTISGIEIDATALLSNNFTVGLQYTYLDGDMPLQPHPFGESAPQQFELLQTPPHAGSLTLDYQLPLSVGLLKAHLDVAATDRYAYSTIPNSRLDAYKVANARLSLDDIPLGAQDGNIDISLWVRNLTDEEYVTLGFTVGAPVATIIQSFGTPRTGGISISYQY